MIASTGNTTSPLINFINDVIENASELPGDLRERANDINDDILNDLIGDDTRAAVGENLITGEAKNTVIKP